MRTEDKTATRYRFQVNNKYSKIIRYETQETRCKIKEIRYVINDMKT